MQPEQLPERLTQFRQGGRGGGAFKPVGQGFVGLPGHPARGEFFLDQIKFRVQSRPYDGNFARA